MPDTKTYNQDLDYRAICIPFQSDHRPVQAKAKKLMFFLTLVQFRLCANMHVKNDEEGNQYPIPTECGAKYTFPI